MGHVTLDSAGGFHIIGNANLQGITGTGLTTGDKYQATGADNFEFNGKVAEERTAAENIHFIGQGRVNNLLVHVTIHITVNADGTMTALVDKFRVSASWGGVPRSKIDRYI